MENVFTFIGAILGHGTEMIIAHLVLVFFFALWIAKISSFKMKAVPTGCQNIMEAYLQGILSMGEGIVGKVLSKEYLPLVGNDRYFYIFIKLNWYYSWF